jgi:hypothetical protein
MSGLQLWLDGSDPFGTGAPIPTGVTLTSWIDKSGNGRNATVTGTFTVVPNSQNGLPAVSMTNSTVNTATNYATVTMDAATVFPTYLKLRQVYRFRVHGRIHDRII